MTEKNNNNQAPNKTEPKPTPPAKPPAISKNKLSPAEKQPTIKADKPSTINKVEAALAPEKAVTEKPADLPGNNISPDAAPTSPDPSSSESKKTPLPETKPEPKIETKLKTEAMLDKKIVEETPSPELKPMPPISAPKKSTPATPTAQPKPIPAPTPAPAPPISQPDNFPARFKDKLKTLRSQANKKRREKVTRNLEKIMEYAFKTERITNNDVEKLIGVKDSQATRYLKKLVKNKKLVQFGIRKNNFYKPIKK